MMRLERLWVLPLGVDELNDMLNLPQVAAVMKNGLEQNQDKEELKCIYEVLQLLGACVVVVDLVVVFVVVIVFVVVVVTAFVAEVALVVVTVEVDLVVVFVVVVVLVFVVVVVDALVVVVTACLFKTSA